MKKVLSFLIALLGLSLPGHAQLTLDYCLERAEANYPLLRKYQIVSQTEALSLADINKSWLPRVGVYAQATIQNRITEYPELLKNILSQSGAAVEGMDKLQYKAGVELNQTIWDGGASKAQRRIQHAAAEQNRSALDVEMYAVRERVMNLYFSILLIEEQAEKVRTTLKLLNSTHERVEALVRGGIAMQSDADMIAAQALSTQQMLIEATNNAETYRNMLEIFIGERIDGQTLLLPSAEMPRMQESDRPELGLFEQRIMLNKAQESAIEASLMPRLAFFAQAFYGYPGFNMFESMMKHDLTFNALAGLKISWNIDSFYTRKNSRSKIALQTKSVETDRDIFLFNNQLKSSQEMKQIEGYHKVLAEDAKIIELRTSVRKAAEAQLRNGILDATALLSKITDENQAMLARAFHEIQLLHTIYQLKHTLNR